jgi:hypothetical protein
VLAGDEVRSRGDLERGTAVVAGNRENVHGFPPGEEYSQDIRSMTGMI